MTAFRALHRTILIVFGAALVASCVSIPAGSPTAQPAQPAGTIAFDGVATPGRSMRHVFMTHGMGPTEPDFDRFLHAGLVEAGYQLEQASGPTSVKLPNTIYVDGEELDCPSGAQAPPCRFETFGEYRVAAYKHRQSGEQLVLYTYFWESALSAIQRPFLVNDLAVKRSPIIGAVKRDTINHGFSDATAYLGPLGSLMRAGTEGAICSMMHHATTTMPPPAGVACTFATLEPGTTFLTPPRLTFITQSLGSRLVFDTLNPFYNRNGGCVDRPAQVQRLILQNTDLFFMLANQLPLLGIGQVEIGTTPPNRASCPVGLGELLAWARPARLDGDRLTIVAFQDPEDLLGFRLAPRLLANSSDGFDFLEVEHRNTPVRSFFGIALSNPKEAHAKELEVETSKRLILCGAAFAERGRLVPASHCQIGPSLGR